MAHRDIVIPFTMELRKYKAVGFLFDGEDLVTRDVMLARVAAEHGGVIGEEDESFIGATQARRDQISQSLVAYHLIANRFVQDGISSFCMRGGKWDREVRFASYDATCLVICRVQ